MKRKRVSIGFFLGITLFFAGSAAAMEELGEQEAARQPRVFILKNGKVFRVRTREEVGTFLHRNTGAAKGTYEISSYSLSSPEKRVTDKDVLFIINDSTVNPYNPTLREAVDSPLFVFT